MRAKLALAIVIGITLSGASLRAHHAFAAEFDANRPLKLKGKLVKWMVINPHSWFQIDVPGADGKVVTWMVEGGSPNQLIRLGVTQKSVPIGIELTVNGYQAKDGSNKAVGASFTLPDGKSLFLGGSAPGGGGDK
jgi:Family of unknown function (DUF6152)